MLQDATIFSGFSVPDLAAAKEFYAQVVGVAIQESPMGLKLPIGGENSVFIYEKADHVPASFTILNFSVKDIDAAVTELTNRGVTFERYADLPAPQDEHGILRGLAANYGPDIAWFKDPGGNILSVLQEA